MNNHLISEIPQKVPAVNVNPFHQPPFRTFGFVGKDLIRSELRRFVLTNGPCLSSFLEVIQAYINVAFSY